MEDLAVLFLVFLVDVADLFLATNPERYSNMISIASARHFGVVVGCLAFQASNMGFIR